MYRTHDELNKHYADKELCKLCNIKQIVFYASNGVQPLMIEEGYGGKLIAFYLITDTKDVWEKWKRNKK
ncbi:MAG TPA: hypothetical protein VK085_09420 [Pseudogracilibacillus sp.]|nr:hypothetical protein [Pseudogracilibacillus sp.]